MKIVPEHSKAFINIVIIKDIVPSQIAKRILNILHIGLREISSKSLFIYIFC